MHTTRQLVLIIGLLWVFNAAVAQSPAPEGACGQEASGDDVQAVGVAVFIGPQLSFMQSVEHPEVGFNEVGGFSIVAPQRALMADPMGQVAPAGVTRRDEPGLVELAFSTPATALAFDIHLPAGDGCNRIRLSALNQEGALILFRDGLRLDPARPEDPISVFIETDAESIARVTIAASDAGDSPVDFSIETLSMTLAAGTIQAFYGNRVGFDAAAGSPPVIIDFDDSAPGTDVTNATLSGVTLRKGSSSSAPLIVVRGADTLTTSGYQFAPNPGTNKLFPTSGENVLSPGGTQLVPGPSSLLENDDLVLAFNPPVNAVGLDVLFQEFDVSSYVGLRVFNASGETLLTQYYIPTNYPGPGDGGGGPGGSTFVGVVSSQADIARILLDDSDPDDYFPDNNVGYDTISAIILPLALCRDVDAPANPATCLADVSVDDGSNNPLGGSVVTTQTPPGPYPPGVHEVTLVVTNDEGASSSCDALVTVVDATAPVIAIHVEPVDGPGGDDDGQGDDDGGAESARLIRFNATDACSAPQTDAALLVPLCPAVGVVDGQVVSFEQTSPGHCQIEVDGGDLSLEGVSFTLKVTARDAAGNESIEERPINAALQPQPIQQPKLQRQQQRQR